MSLKDKINNYNPADDPDLLNVKDVKEAVEELKEELSWQTGGVGTYCCEKINKIFGDLK